MAKKASGDRFPGHCIGKATQFPNALTLGKKGGRTPRRAEEPRVRIAYTMYVDQRLSVQDICRVLRISQATFYRYVALGRRAAETP